MKSLVKKALFATINISAVSAQRPSRSGGSSGAGRPSSSAPSRGGGASSMSRPSVPSREYYRPASGYNRPVVGSRPGYGYNRPGYRSGYSYRPGYGYRPYYGYYNYYRPFIGFRLTVLPFGYYPFYSGANQFYYSDGLFYQQSDNNYQVVVPPVGAEVPSGANLVTIDGVDYYEFKGVYYTQNTNADGKVVYVVAGKDGVLNTTDGPIDTHQVGDIIKQLPEGCREVTIKGEKYFVSPDDVYYETIVDGNNTSYKIIGKIF